MKYIKLFESFVQSLDEIKLDDHWIERTSLKGETYEYDSRIIPRGSKFPYGYRIANFVDGKRINEYSMDYVLSSINKDEEFLNDLIIKALYAITRSKRLRNWNPSNDKEIQLMRLGKICIYDGKNKYYPCLAAGNGEGGEYPSGEIIWGFVKERDLGITIKYYSDDKEGMDKMYKSAMDDSGYRDFIFYKNSEIVYPYGKDFEIIIDLSDPDIESIERKISDQAEGIEIELGPQPEKYYAPLKIKEEKILRKTISPGEEIGLMIGFISKEIPTLGIITSIENMQQIKDAQKIKSLDSIKEIIVGFIPTSSDKKIPIKVKLKDGSIIQIGGKNYKILGPTGGKPLITSEPSIIELDKIQTWVEGL